MHSVRPDPHPAGKRLVDVPEQQVPGLGPLDLRQQRGTASFQPPGNRVVEQFRHRGRDVRAQHVGAADRRHLRRVGIVVKLVGRAVRRAQPTAHEAERPSAEFHAFAVEDVMARPQMLGPHLRQVHVPVGQIGGLGQGGEQFRVLPRGGGPHMPRRVAAEAPPQARRHLPGLTEALGGAQRDEPPGRVGAEQLREDPPRLIGIVHEQEQIAEAEQGVRAVPRPREGHRPGHAHR